MTDKLNAQLDGLPSINEVIEYETKIKSMESQIKELKAQLKKAKSRAPEFTPRQRVMISGHPVIKGECEVTEVVLKSKQQRFFVLPTGCTKKGVSGYEVDASMMTAKYKPKTK